MPRELFKPGQSGNPKGKPPGVKSMKTMAQEAFVKMMEAKSKGAKGVDTTFLEQYLASFQESALKPGSTAFGMVASRLFGDDILDQIDAQLNRAKREDMDFLSYRFYKDFHGIQRDAFLSKDKLKVIEWGRRTGKTEFFVKDAAHDATIRPDSPIIYFGLTFERAKDLFFKPVLEELRSKGVPLKKVDETAGEIHLENGSVIYISGTHTSRDRNKWRGRYFWKAYLDECQDMAGLAELYLEILAPAMVDLDGTITLAGTGPKTRGTWWELIRNDESRFKGFRSNGNLSMNPYIIDHDKALERIREQFGFDENDPIYIREYLGGDAYDDDALVLRFTEENYFQDADIVVWLADQSPEDVKFLSGLDYGYDASDAHGVLIYSEKRNEKFLVWEYKASGTDVTTLVEAMQRSEIYVKTDPLFDRSYHRNFLTFADTSDKKISTELSMRYGIPVNDAIKVDKVLGIQMLQAEVKRGFLKVRKGGPMDTEALRTIFKRTEQQVLTRELDDTYHPDMFFAVLYAFRNYWLTHDPDHYVAPATRPENPNEPYWEEQAKLAHLDRQLY